MDRSMTMEQLLVMLGRVWPDYKDKLTVFQVLSRIGVLFFLYCPRRDPSVVVTINIGGIHVRLESGCEGKVWSSYWHRGSRYRQQVPLYSNGPHADSTGYEALASAKMSATRGRAASHYNIASDEEMNGQHSAVDNKFALSRAASSTNEKSDGPGSRPLAGAVTSASRRRSRSSRSTSKS